MKRGASKNPMYFAFWADRWLGGTSGWTAEEKGIYISLLVHQFVHGSVPKDLDRMARIAGCSTDAVRAAWQSVLSNKFEQEGDGLVNARMAEERNRASEHLKQRSEAGRRSASRRRGSTSVATTVATTDGTTQTQTQTQTQDLELDDLLLDTLTSNKRVLKAAQRWQDYRRESRLKAWTVTTWRKRLAEAEQDPGRFEEMVEHSISNGYQGLFGGKRQPKFDDSGVPKALQALKDWHDEAEMEEG